MASPNAGNVMEICTSTENRRVIKLPPIRTGPEIQRGRWGMSMKEYVEILSFKIPLDDISKDKSESF